MRNAELLGDLAQIARDSALVLHHRCAADDFEVGNLSKVGKNLILYTISEISVLFIIAQVLERQHGDALFGSGRTARAHYLWASFPWMPEPITCKCKCRDQQTDATQNPNPATARDRATVAACSFDCARFDIEAPRQNKREGKTQSYQNNK